MGYLLIYNGSLAFVMTALYLAAAGYATFATRILPRWTGWLAYAATVLCVASIPAIYGGPADPAGRYNAGGWGPGHPRQLPAIALVPGRGQPADLEAPVHRVGCVCCIAHSPTGRPSLVN